jgi:signal peptidase I
MMCSDTTLRFYHGESMFPTFRLGDYLEIVSFSKDDICPGDVIDFRRMNLQGEPEEIVHRVVAILEDGFITRGDNRLHCDLSPVQMEQIVGKVEIIHRRGGKKLVRHGINGLRIAMFQQLVLHLNYWARRLFRDPYHFLHFSGIISRLWQPVLNRLTLQTERGPLIKYIYRQHTVAVWDLTLKRFDCRKPFDLVIPNPEKK